MPRPSTSTPALAELLLERIADGMSLCEACRDEAMPGRETVRRWLRDDREFEQRYARAIEQRSDAFLEGIIDISEDGTNDWMDHRRADGTIERVDPDSPASIAFRAALRRKGIEADAAGGLQALDDLMHAVVEADEDRAGPHVAILREAWAGLLPGRGRRAQL